MIVLEAQKNVKFFYILGAVHKLRTLSLKKRKWVPKISRNLTEREGDLENLTSDFLTIEILHENHENFSFLVKIFLTNQS